MIPDVEEQLEDFVRTRRGWMVAQFTTRGVFYGKRLFNEEGVCVRAWPNQVTGFAGWHVSCVNRTSQFFSFSGDKDAALAEIASVEKALEFAQQLRMCSTSMQARDLATPIRPKQIEVLAKALDVRKRGSLSATLEMIVSQVSGFRINVDPWRFTNV